MVRIAKQEIKTPLTNLTVSYGFYDTQWGKACIAASEHGLCYYAFTDSIDDLMTRWPHAAANENQMPQDELLAQDLHLIGTPFQLSVWEELLKIPEGQTVSYQDIATKLGKPKASRAIGNAVGANPIAIIVPCHRVIHTSGKVTGYRWGKERKLSLLTSEKSSN